MPMTFHNLNMFCPLVLVWLTMTMTVQKTNKPLLESFYTVQCLDSLQRIFVFYNLGAKSPVCIFQSNTNEFFRVPQGIQKCMKFLNNPRTIITEVLPGMSAFHFHCLSNLVKITEPLVVALAVRTFTYSRTSEQMDVAA